jgi:hypothetical protein
MPFQITGLDASPFRRFYGLSDEELHSLGVKRFIADKKPGFPDRIELRDAEQGEAVLLLNYLHQPADTPYKASHAIFVREWAETPPRTRFRTSFVSVRFRCAPSTPRATWSTPISSLPEATLSPRSSACWPILKPPISTRITPSAAAMRRGSTGHEAERGVAPVRYVT